MQVYMYLIYASHTYLLIHLWITSSPITYIFSYAMPYFKLARQIRNQHACSIMFIFYCVLSTQWKGHMIYRVLNSDNISKYLLLLRFYLLSMKHGLSWEGAAPESDAGCGVWHGCLRVYAASDLFFFFSRIRVDSARFAPTRLLFSPTRPESSRIRSYWLATETALNHAKTAEIGFEWGLHLSFLNFILKICCFFCVFFFVLCFLPSSFFVLWIKA